MARRIHPITALLEKGATFDFTDAAEVGAPPILFFLDWNAVTEKSQPLRLHCDASFGVTHEQEQCDGSVRAIVYISRAILANEQNCTPYGTRRWIHSLEHSTPEKLLFNVFFSVFTVH